MFRIVYPKKCILCNRLLSKEETDLCHSCRADAPEFVYSKRSVPFVAKWISLWYYRNNVIQSIHRFKFYNERSYANAYARLLAVKLLEEDFVENDTLITWAPVSLLRRFTRGYDQSALVAKALAKELGCEAVRCLRKIRHTSPQSVSQSPSSRRANVLGVYRAVNCEQFRGKRILLVDDVLTTGATVSECAKMLLIASAQEVRVATIATSYSDNSKKYR